MAIGFSNQMYNMKKILVVNNDVDTMSLLKSWLEKKSYTVKYTGNPDEAVKIAKEFFPQIALIDVLKKDVAEEIKKDKETSSIPIILMTGYTVRQKINREFIDDTIEKPFNLPLLEKKIEKLLKISEQIQKEFF